MNNGLPLIGDRYVSTRMKHSLVHYPFSLFLALIICVGSLLPLSVSAIPHFQWTDKVVHLLMYFVLTGCMLMERKRSFRSSENRQPHSLKGWGGFLLIPVCLGGLLELGQEYLPVNRNGDWADFAANSLGCVLAALIAVAFRCNRCRSKDKDIPIEKG